MRVQYVVDILDNQELNAVDKALLEPDEPITWKEFKKQLGLLEYNENKKDNFHEELRAQLLQDPEFVEEYENFSLKFELDKELKSAHAEVKLLHTVGGFFSLTNFII